MTTLDEQLWMQSQMDKTMQANAGVAPSSVSTISNNTGGMPLGMGSGAVNIPPAPVQQRTESDLYAVQEKKRLAALDAQKRSALSSLEAERGQINPAFNTALSNVAGTSALQARNLAEFLASRGQTQSGIAAQGAMVSSANLMNQQGQLEQIRGNAISDIARRQTEVGSAYDQGALQAALDREANTIESQIAASERARAESIGTVGQYGQDFAAEINRIEAEIARGDNSRAYLLPYLRIARQEKVAGISEAQAKAEQEEWDRWLDVQRLRRMGGGGRDKPELDEPSRTYAQVQKDYYDNGMRDADTLRTMAYYNPTFVNISASGLSGEPWEATNPRNDKTVTINPITQQYLINDTSLSRLLQQRPSAQEKFFLIRTLSEQGRITDTQAYTMMAQYGLMR